MNKRFPTPLLALLLAFAAPLGCSADQPPAASEAATAMQEQAPVATVAAEVAPPAEVAASDEDMPEPETLVVAQAEIANEKAASTPKPAKPAPFRVGDHYTLLAPAQPTGAAPGKTEIAESFMYGCPHCFSIEPYLEKWELEMPAYVEFVRIPALFNGPARTHARVYYTAEALGILDQTHMAFFREIHVNRKSMTKENELEAFFAGFGVDSETFRSTFNSFAVDTNLRRAEALNRRYRIASTPIIIVNGKYLVNGSKITSYPQMLEVADYLAAKEAGRE